MNTRRDSKTPSSDCFVNRQSSALGRGLSTSSATSMTGSAQIADLRRVALDGSFLADTRPPRRMLDSVHNLL
jgi:hypothetical protein